MNGAYIYRIGYVVLEDFVVAGNLLVGIEVSLTDLSEDLTAQIKDALVIG